MPLTQPARRFEPDSPGCTMAHANGANDGFHDLPSLRLPREVQVIGDPRVSPAAFNNLGAFSGATMAVCASETASHPALAAFDLEDGRVLWTSPHQDLPAFQGTRRRVPGLVIARPTGDAGSRRVFAGNWAHLAAYDEDGGRLWSSRTTALLPPELGHPGRPKSLRLDASGGLVAVYTRGWLVRVDCERGVATAYHRLVGEVGCGADRVSGAFEPTKSPVVVGDVAYLVMMLEPMVGSVGTSELRRVCLLRIDLGWIGQGTEGAHAIIDLGLSRSGASAAAWRRADGAIVIFAHTYLERAGAAVPGIIAVVDRGGELQPLWHCALSLPPDRDVHSGLAVHPASGTLIVSSTAGLFVFPDAPTLEGEVPCPAPLAMSAVVSPHVRSGARRLTVGSPVALTEDRERDELVAYTNVIAGAAHARRTHGFLTAFAMAPGRPEEAHPLWTEPLALTAEGEPAPGYGTFGQPALFRLPRSGGTGLIVNTVDTGTVIIR